jgi:hypothetical protein
MWLFFAVVLLTYAPIAGAQDQPKAVIARQARGIDIETHLDLLIGAEEARNHIHELVMVCGLIVETYFEYSNNDYLDSSYYAGARNTYLYFDKPRGEHDFVAVVHGKVRKELPEGPESFKDRRACVFGKVSRYREKAAIQVVRPEQIATLEFSEETLE